MKKHLFTLLLACLCFSGLAQSIDPDLALEMSQREENEKIKVHILMKAKLDQISLVRQADYYVNQEERRIFVVNELKEFATASQFDLQNALREMQRNGLVEKHPFQLDCQHDCLRSHQIGHQRHCKPQ